MEVETLINEKDAGVRTTHALGTRVKGGRYTMQMNHTSNPPQEQSKSRQLCLAIPLTKGQFAIIDIVDAELANYTWHAQTRAGYENEYYATRYNAKDRKNRRPVPLHKDVLERKLGITLDSKTDRVDHINHNTLDNRRENLRLATHAQNVQYRKTPKNNTSGYKGVVWNGSRSKWKAQIGYAKNYKTLGHFDDKIEAAKAYNKAAIERYGDFAYLNDVGGE